MNILIAVDGSKYARWATEWAARLPLKKRGKVTALHAIDLGALSSPLVPPAPAWDAPYLKKETVRLEAHGQSVARDTKHLFKVLKLKGAMVLEHGSTASTILDHAKTAGTLVVLGSRGLDAMDRVMLGSVSTKVVHHAAGPVLVVKQPSRAIRKVVLATDGSEASDKALRFLLHEMSPGGDGARGCDVAILHAMRLFRYPELKEAGHAVVERAAVRLEAVGYRVEPVFKIGNAAEEILKFAERRKSDMIVTGARGHGAIARFLLGSVSTKLVQHSHCSILVVR